MNMKDVKDLFIPYELAVIAKEKGFNEPCFGSYRINSPNFFSPNKCDKNGDITLLAPIYQQIVDWFREKHKIYITVVPFKAIPLSGIFKRTFYDYVLYCDSIAENKKEQQFNSHYEALMNAIQQAFNIIK